MYLSWIYLIGNTSTIFIAKFLKVGQHLGLYNPLYLKIGLFQLKFGNYEGMIPVGGFRGVNGAEIDDFEPKSQFWCVQFKINFHEN